MREECVLGRMTQELHCPPKDAESRRWDYIWAVLHGLVTHHISACLICMVSLTWIILSGQMDKQALPKGSSSTAAEGPAVVQVCQKASKTPGPDVIIPWAVQIQSLLWGDSIHCSKKRKEISSQPRELVMRVLGEKRKGKWKEKKEETILLRNSQYLLANEPWLKQWSLVFPEAHTNKGV